jgi:hypothetical protein
MANNETGIIDEEYRTEYVADRVKTTMTTWMALTVGCAQCHDHKYDPIPQSDFYRLQAFVKPAWRGEKPAELLPEESFGDLPARKAAAEAELLQLRAAHEYYRAQLREKLAAALAVPSAQLPDEVFKKALKGEKIPINKPSGDAVPTPTSAEANAVVEANAATEASAQPTFEFKKEDREKLGELSEALDNFDEGERYDSLVDTINFQRKERKRRDDDDDDDDEREMKKEEMEGKNALTYVLLNGDPFAPGEQVQPGGLSAVDSWSEELDQQIAGSATTIDQRRRVLADWIANPKNPLTMRVYVNRIWQYHFGVGIVRTANDFGVNGSGASHPELLDFLTAWFIEHGEQTKPLHRLIVLSRTYRSATQHADWDASATIDPENRYLWHAPLRRLESEVLRDALLSISGRLNSERGGPGFFEELPEGMPTEYPFFKWKLSSPSQRARRSIYMYQRRNLIHPFMEAFDAADFSQSCERRSRSVTASQALSLMNGNLANEASLQLARNIQNECSCENSHKITDLFEAALSRPPTADELADADSFLSLKMKHYAERSATAEKTEQSPETLALRDLALVLFNTNEFLYLD